MQPLQDYAKKRDFKKTREPLPAVPQKGRSRAPIFVVQEHHASHLHYDFRLELDGVLKSWAVPKGPPSVPGEKRLAVEVEDHPLSYAKFAGTIPEGQYGAGEVSIWDKGVWNPPDHPAEALRKGHLEFTLKGKKLAGAWLLIRTKGFSGKKNQWLLIKRSDSPRTEEKTSRPVALTSPDKIIYENEGITKLQIAEYYQKVAPLLLPHIKGRPLSILRCPAGSEGTCFFQKHYKQGAPEVLRCIRLQEKTKEACYLAADSGKALEALVQIGALEIHPWNSQEKDLERPDQLVLDFDPGPGVPWEKVVSASQILRDLLKNQGLQSFVKVTGGKGIHVHVPIAPLYSWDQVRTYSKSLAGQVAALEPSLYVTEMSKKLRKNKIFIDYLRNSRGSTAVAPYSLRAKPTSAVALPLSWQELSKVTSSDAFTLTKTLKKIAQRTKDPWADYFKLRQRIPALE